MKIGGNWALVPLKVAAEAKTRLAGLLNAQQRASLQHAMLADLLEGLASSRLLSGIALYGPEPQHPPDVTDVRPIRLQQPTHIHGLNAAVTEGVQRLAHAGADTIAVLPGDLPLIDGAELDHALSDVARRHHCAVIPDRWHLGTNGLIFPAGARLRFGFGLRSFPRHLGDGGDAAACWREAVELMSFADDIDTCDDLATFRLKQRGTRGQRTRAVIDATVPAPTLTAAAKETSL